MRCCATAGTFLLAARSCGAPRRAWQACWATQERRSEKASEPASRTAQPQAPVQRNLRTRLCLISKSNHHEDYPSPADSPHLCGHDVDNDDGQPSRNTRQVSYVQSPKLAMATTVRACMQRASFYFSACASSVRRRQCQRLIVPSSSPPPQQPGSLRRPPMLAERAPAAYRGLCMRAAPKRTRVQTVCKRAADLQHLLESATRPPSSTLPSLAQAACTRYAPSTSLSPDQLGTQPQTGNLLMNSCTTGHRGSMFTNYRIL